MDETIDEILLELKELSASIESVPYGKLTKRFSQLQRATLEKLKDIIDTDKLEFDEILDRLERASEVASSLRRDLSRLKIAVKKGYITAINLSNISSKKGDDDVFILSEELRKIQREEEESYEAINSFYQNITSLLLTSVKLLRSFFERVENKKNQLNSLFKEMEKLFKDLGDVIDAGSSCKREAADRIERITRRVEEIWRLKGSESGEKNRD